MDELPQMSEEELKAYIESLKAMARSGVREDAIFLISNLLREHAFGPDYEVVKNYPRRFVLSGSEKPLWVDFAPGQKEPLEFVIRHNQRIVMSGVLAAEDGYEGAGTYYDNSSDILISAWDRGPWEELMWEGVERVEILTEWNNAPEV